MPARRIKVRGGSLGPILCWAVVFADIGTSIYYTPGILYGQVGDRAAIFVGMTLLVFLLLAVKYSEVAWRYPEGGGVVTVASRALHPFAGLIGGLFIQVDYFLTAALSALSGVIYLSVVAPALQSVVLATTIGALVLLAGLNLFGIRESARVSATVALAAGGLQLVVVLLVAVHLGPSGIGHSFTALAGGPRLPPIALLTGFAGAFLAFSGLESISQLAPAMREPRNRVAPRAMLLVVGSMVATSPLLTLWSTTLVDVQHSDPNQLISILGGMSGGTLVADAVAISGALLLVFASNTAIIGCYHVFLALSRMGFLPGVLAARNRMRGTPHVAILLSAGVPIGVVAMANGNVTLLGDLYAFGLLGAFTLTCLSLDIVRWYERPDRLDARARFGFGVGVATTLLVATAWTVNLFNKPLATLFGGATVLVGLTIAIITVYVGQQLGRPLVLPFLVRPNRTVIPISGARLMRPAHVLAILPHDAERLDAVIHSAVRSAAGRPIVFLFRGKRTAPPRSQLFEVRDPYLEDRHAKRAFARAETLARRSISDRRYAYLPGEYDRTSLETIWRAVNAHEMVIADGEQALLPVTAVDRVKRLYEQSFPVLHLVSGQLSHLRLRPERVGAPFEGR